MKFLSEAEGREIQNVRALMLTIAKRLRDAGFEAGSEHRAFSLGEVSHAFEEAEAGLFDALNMLQAHGECEVAEQFAVYVKREEYAPAQ